MRRPLQLSLPLRRLILARAFLGRWSTYNSRYTVRTRLHVVQLPARPSSPDAGVNSPSRRGFASLASSTMAFLSGWSRNRKLSLSWLLLTLAFLASGVVLVVVAAVFRMQAGKLDEHLLRSLVIGRMNLTSKL